MPEITISLLTFDILLFCFVLSVVFCFIFLFFYITERSAFRMFRKDLHFDSLNLRTLSESIYQYICGGNGIYSDYVYSYDEPEKLSAGVLLVPIKAMPVLTEICEKALELHSLGVTPKICLSSLEYNKVVEVESITHNGCNARITGILKKRNANLTFVADFMKDSIDHV